MKKYFLIFFSILFCLKNKDNELLLLLNLEDNKIDYFFSNPFDYLNNLKIREEITNLIEETKEEIYIFSYGLDEEEIIKSIYKIYNKGIKVRIIGSPDQNYDKIIHLSLPLEIRQRQGLQHIKLILSDRTKLLSGTGNFTKSDIFYNSNLFFKLNISEEIGNLIIKKFYKLNYNSPIFIQTPFYKIKILQSPENGKEIQSIINNSILFAKNRVNFYMYSFYDPTIMNSLYFKSFEIPIYGIIDSSNLKEDNFIWEFLGKNSNLWIYQENFNFGYLDQNFIQHGGKLHHKTIIIDDILYTGSYNFSLSARDSNSEIFFSIEDPLQIQKVISNYNQIYNYSSLIISRNNDSTINDTFLNNNFFCQQTNGNSFYFQNKNSFFFMEYIQNAKCPSDRNSYSSGIVSNSSDGFLYNKGISIKDFGEVKMLSLNNFVYSNFFECQNAFCDICEILKCDFKKIYFYNPYSRIIHLDLEDILEEFYVWDGEKILKGKIIQKIQLGQKYVYQFTVEDLNGNLYTNLLNEFIIFFRYKKNLYFGCVQKGKLRKNLTTFLTLQEWYLEKTYNWQDLCFQLE